MKFLTTKFDQLKSVYQKNKPLGFLFGIGVGLICLALLPEIMVLVCPKAIWNKVWNLKLPKIQRIIALIVSYIVFVIAVYFLFILVKTVLLNSLLKLIFG